MSAQVQNRKRTRGIAIIVSLLVIVLLISYFWNSPEEPITFIVAQDQRYKATEKYHRPDFYMGALLKIKEVGRGDFMLSPGDMNPMKSTRDLVAEILGEDYPWYPGVGNHDMEDPGSMAFIREYNRNGNSLPNIVRFGPPGSEETTYSFEIGNCHIVVLNVYYDGKSDIGADGDVCPELLTWLEEDLKNTEKPYIFVAAHEPLLAQPDMDNGRIRHQGDSLDKYYRNAYKLRELLKKYNVRGIFNGHTHGASVCKINGLWQIDSGHAYGIENPFPEYIYNEIKNTIEEESGKGKSENEIITDLFNSDIYDTKKVLYYTGLSNGVHYKEFSDEKGLEYLFQFWNSCKENPAMLQKYIKTFNENHVLSRSTFLKVTVQEPVRIDVYRDDARGGEYKLMHTFYLD